MKIDPKTMQPITSKEEREKISAENKKTDKEKN